jgi:chromosome segregation ATPase
MSSELFKEREAQRELRQTRQTFATLHHSKEMSDMCYELSKEHAAQRELSQKLDALHRVKAMTDLALQSERHEHERTRARLDAVERVVLQANELANQLDRERQMHEATALDLANVLARERSVHDTMRQQLSQQQLDLQSAETQAARESTTQQRQLSERLGTCEAALARRDERLGTCEAALARRDERINELERAKYELSLQLDVAQLAQRDATAQLDTALLTRRELETQLEATQRGDIEAIASQFAAVRQRNSELEAELRLATKELQAARQRNSMLLLTSQLKPKR